MKNIICALVSAVFLFTVSGCIKNDIPYPKRLGTITAFEVQGQLSAAVIDSSALTVSVDMADTVIMSHVRLLRFELRPLTRPLSICRLRCTMS